MADNRATRKTLLAPTFSAWLLSPTYPDLPTEHPRHPRPDRPLHTTINLAFICYCHPTKPGAFPTLWQRATTTRRWHQFAAVWKEIVLAQFHTIQRRHLRSAIAKYFDDATTEVANSTDDLWTVFKCFRIGTGSRRVHAFSRAVPAIADQDGNLYPDATALANAWVQHFANTEGGNAVEASAIADIAFSERETE